MTIKPKNGYSVANLTVEARGVETFGNDTGVSDLLNEGRMEIIVPAPSKDDCEQYGLEFGDDWDDGRQGACEYRDSFVPMMNSLWPVDIAYERSAETTAELMQQYAGATSLVTIDDEHYIAMTGGGMDLSWHLAAAYVCCGAVPPLYILTSLKGSPFRLSDKVNREIASAMRQGASHLRYKAKSVADDARAIAAQLKSTKPLKKAA